MTIAFTHAPTAAAVNAALDQQTQIAAAVALWAGGNVTARVYSAVGTLLDVQTYGPWQINNSTEPCFAEIGPLLARTAIADGAPARVEFVTGSTPVFEMSAGVGTGDIQFDASVSAFARTRVDAVDGSAGARVSANTSLPFTPAEPTFALTFALADNTSAGVAASGSVVNTGNQPQAWSITAPAGVTVSPSFGTLAAGATQVISVTAATPGSYSLSLTAAGAVITGNPQSLSVSAGPATSFTLAVPLSGITGSAASLVVTPNGPVTAGATVNLSLSGGGSLGAATLTWTAGEAGAKSTTLTRTVDGATTVTMTNSAGLANLGTPATFTSVAPGTPFTTLTLSNPSGSAQTANWITPMFGHAFRQGDVPAGEFPAFAVAGGEACPSTQWGHTYWPDGSLRFCAAMLRVPSGVAAGGTVTVSVSSSPSGPSPSVLSAATVAAASDIKVEATGLRNWAASLWVSSLNQGIADGDVQVVGSGDAGIVLRVYEGFRTAGADHGQAGVWHYVAALQSSAGGLYGLRYIGKFANGWHDVALPQINVLVAEGVALRNGAATVRNIGPSAAPRGFSWSSGFSASSVAGLLSGSPVKLTTTGTLPSGLSPTAVYFVRLTGGSGFTLHNSLNEVAFNSNAALATDAGTGTHTITPVFHLESYAAGPYTCGSNGLWDFIAAGGSGTETPCFVTVDRAYGTLTRVLGPLRSNVAATVIATRSYATDTYVDLVVAQDTTGERPDIGYMTGWCIRQWMRGDGLQTIRVHGLQMAAKSWSLRRLATKAPLNLTNEALAGMGAALPSYRYRPSNTAANSGVNAAADFGKVFGAQDWAHQPQMLAYVYFITGEPQYADAMHDMANAAIANVGDRNPTVSGTTYRGVVLRDGQQRVEGWVLRDVAWVAMFTPDTYLGAAIGTHAKTILASNFDYLKAAKLTGTSFTIANKFYPNPNPSPGPWQIAYLLSAVNLAFTATADADARTAAEDIIANYDAMRQAKGLHTISSYYLDFVGGTLGMTSWDNVLFRGALGTVVSDAATDVLTVSVPSGYGALTNGAIVMNQGFPPGGVTQGQPYFVRDLSGASFKLASSAGGTAIDLTTSGSIGSDYWSYSAGGSSNTSFANGVFPKSYGAMIVSGTRWAKALGMTVPPAFESAVESVYGAGPSFADDPVYAMKNSF